MDTHDSTSNNMGETMQAAQDKTKEMGGATHDRENQASDMAGQKWEDTKQGGNMLQQAGDKMGETFNNAKDKTTGNQ